MRCNVAQVTWTHTGTPSRNVLQCVAVCCNVLQCVAIRCSVLQCVAACCSVLHCVAVYYNLLHCVAVYCNFLQCFALYYLFYNETRKHGISTTLEKVFSDILGDLWNR